MIESAMRVSSITIYPIKSCRGISLQSAIVEERGLRYDRRWMLVDENNSFLSQRKHPKMSLIDIAIRENSLFVSAPKMESISIPLQSEEKENISVTIWDDIVSAIEADEIISEWFSDFLHTDCKLVFQPDESIRTVDAKYARANEHTSFADAFPFLIISDSSLDALNKKLSLPVPMNRFRPNITISGCEPFAEDLWKKIRINNILFSLVKPCARCVVTTIDQVSGETGKEPLRTLSEFRTFNNKVMFGQNAITDTVGEIFIGNAVEIVQE